MENPFLSRKVLPSLAAKKDLFVAIAAFYFEFPLQAKNTALAAPLEHPKVLTPYEINVPYMGKALSLAYHQSRKRFLKVFFDDNRWVFLLQLF